MSKTELNVLFKKMQRDDKKEVLKFEVQGDSENKTYPLLELAGDIINFEIEGSETGAITAEFKKMNKDSKKVVLDFVLKGDSEKKALDLYQYAGNNVKMYIEPSQMSLEDFNDQGSDDEEDREDPHEGIEYAVDVTGAVDVKEEDEPESDEDDGMFDAPTDDEELEG